MSVFCIMWMMVLLFSEARSNYCRTNWTVELKRPTVFDNLTILDEEDGAVYTPNSYMRQEGENNTKYLGCLCDVKICIRKCCPLGENLGLENEEICVPRLGDDTDFMVNVTDTKTKISYLVNQTSHFRWISGGYVFDESWYYLDPENYTQDVYYINAENGKLITPKISNTSYGIDNFCIDYFNQTNEYKVIVRNNDSSTDSSIQVKRILYPVLMTLSLPPLLITFLVYASIAELRNLHGYCLLSYITCLFFFYVSFAMGHNGMDWLPVGACYFVGFSCVFWFHGVFFWLNAMGLDVCITFSKIRPLTGTEQEKEKKKFIYYSLYCWACASVFLIAAIVFEFADIPDDFVKPGIASDRCWFKTAKAALCFCYAPASILMICNIIMFILTAFNLMKLRREMRVMKKAGCGSNEGRRKKSMFYMKLVTIMGINWALEITSWAAGGEYYWWFCTDIFNCLQGLFVFFIFVCTGKPKELAMKKFFPRKRRCESQGAVTAMKWKAGTESDPQKSSISGDTSSTFV